MRGDLTTLDHVKAWLAPGSGTLATANDVLLQRLITACSRAVISYISRDIVVTEYDEWYDSGGVNFLNLRQWPILAIESVQFGAITVTEAASGTPPLNGFRIIEESRLMVTPWCFPRGRSTVNVRYTAGYRTLAEPHEVTDDLAPPAADPVSTDLVWLSDLGVTLNGVSLVPVDGTPASGQYAVSDSGSYQFADDAVGETVLITYSSVPADLEEAVTEMVGERYKQRDRIGMNSKSLPNGETVSFLVKSMSDYIKQALEPYVRVFS